MAKGVKEALDAIKEREEAKCVILALAGSEDRKCLISIAETEAQDRSIAGDCIRTAAGRAGGGKSFKII